MTGSSHFLRRELREIVEDSLPDLEKAKRLYAYVRDNFTTKGSDLFARWRSWRMNWPNMGKTKVV
jgi:hypothetical protein